MGKSQVRATATITFLPPDALVADPRNPRTHSRDQIQAIARSIEAFGFNAPILVDKSNRIVAGHGRLEAAKLLALVEIPVVRLDHLTEQQAKAYMLADNKLTDRSQWDDNRVAAILKELSGIALSFEIEATGFEMPEVDLRIQSLEAPEHTEPEDELEHSAGPTVSRQGDLWLLDCHRLYCGSALDGQSYQALLALRRQALSSPTRPTT